MIRIDNLVVSYNRNTQVIDELNGRFVRHAIHGIVGMNGSGKTTLLNTIYGIKKADSGEILCDERPLAKESMAYLVTENFFYPNITGREYLALFRNKSFDTEQWNTLFRLPLAQIIDDYSTGMKKKLALMAILKMDKDIMILDEPFNGLDMETCKVIEMILQRLRAKGKTILITSHIIETLTNLCDEIHYLQDGRITMSKSKDEFPAFERDLMASIESRNEQLIDNLLNRS